MHLLGCILAVSAVVMMPVAVQAQTAIDRVLVALNIPETAAIMRIEGLRNGDELAQSMLDDESDVGWAGEVARIYDATKMITRVDAALREALQTRPDHADALARFFESDLGRSSVALEIKAREAFLDPKIETEARDVYSSRPENREALITQIDRLIQSGDLVGYNVMGAMNANLMFYRGMVDGGALEMSEGDILQEVWAQEEDITVDSAEWIGAFLMTAYAPMSTPERDRVIAFMTTDAGQAFNAALFSAYDQLYADISYLLGQAMARQLQTALQNAEEL